MENHLEDFKRDLAVAAHGITAQEAWAKGICIECKQPALPKCRTEEGRGEYKISGMCEECFDTLFAEDECSDEPCVTYTRCGQHSDIGQINSGSGGECGECIRQQCWKDMLGLIAHTIEDTPSGMDGKDALAALEESLLVEGIGTFGISDELENASHGAS